MSGKRSLRLILLALLILLSIPISAQAGSSWRSSYRNFLKHNFTVRNDQYIGLIDIGRDGIPEMLYMDQSGNYRNPKLRIVGMVGGKAKIVSTRSLGYVIEGFRINVYHQGGQYRILVYAAYYPKKNGPNLHEYYYRLTAVSSKKYSFYLDHGYNWNMHNDNVIFYVDGSATSEDAYGAYTDSFEQQWTECDQAFGCYGRRSSMTKLLQLYDANAASYSLIY